MATEARASCRRALERRAAEDAERQERARLADQALATALNGRDASRGHQQDQEHHTSS